jgi:hypothetical protein
VFLPGRISGNRVAATRLQRPPRALSFDFAFDLVRTTQTAIGARWDAYQAKIEEQFNAGVKE